MPTILNIIENTKEGAFKAGVYSLFDAYKYKEMDNNFDNIGEIDISELELSNDRYSIGKIKRNSSKDVEVVNVSDGTYCANGTLEELDIIKGDCSNLDSTAPVINNISIEKTTSSMTVIVSFGEPDSFIDGYEFRLLDSSNNVVRDWESGDTLTGSGNNRVTTKSYTRLTQNTTYKVEVRITNTSDSENNNVTGNETVTLNSFNTPEISYNTSDYEINKIVTLTYDMGVTTRYKIVDNNLNTIVAWTTLNNTSETITISNYDYTVIIESTDGTTTLSNSSLIGYIDYTKPNINVSNVDSNWNTSDEVTMTMTDNISGVNKWCITNINSSEGCTWNNITPTTNTSINHTVISNGNYYVFVGDLSGNISNSYELEITKVDTTTPTGVNVSITGTTTKSISVQASGNEDISGITKYEFSKDNGSTWIDNGTETNYTFDNLISGAYVITVRVTNGAGLTSTNTTPSTQTVAMTAPILVVNTIEWATSKTVTITYPSGFTNYYKIGTGDWTLVTGTSKELTITTTGTEVSARIYDGTNYSGSGSITVNNIDTATPANPTISASDSITSNNWHTANFTLTFSGSTSTSGITYYYGTSTSNMTSTGASINVTESVASQTYYVKACNGAGTCSGNSSYIVKLEAGTPTTPVITGGSNDYATTRTISVSTASTATSGIAKYQYYISTSSSTQTGGSWIDGSSITDTTNGISYIYMRAVSNAGKTSGVSIYQATYIDKNSPTISIKTAGSATITQGDSNIIIDTYFNYSQNGDAPITSTSCIDTSNSNAVVANTSSLSVGTHNIKCTITKSTGLNANATKTIIVNSAIYSESILNGAIPEIYTGLIPVTIENDGTVKVANQSSSWYSYAEKRWANAVTVNNATYRTAAPGTAIPEANILVYYVWIPRYKYLLFNTNNGSVSEQAITIQFENKNATKSTGTTNGTYLTHPAFTFGSKELNGIWVSKFEATGSTTALTSKPNLSSLRSQKVSSMFTATRNMEKAYNTYGFTSETGTLNADGTYTTTNGIDSHMMKNMEWGATAYLTQSNYGKCNNGTCTEVGINNNSSFITGCGNVAGSSKTTTCNSYTNALGSTTGNIYGVYDMSGGAHEYVMGNTKNSSNSFYSSIAGFSTAPNTKYYDAYAYDSSYTSYSRGLLGDATKETLKIYGNTNGGWYSDYARFPYGSNSWFLRGAYCHYSSKAGVFYFNYDGGGGNSSNSFRFVLAAE